MDFDLVVSVAKQMRNVSFVFAGPTDVSAPAIPQIDNLHFIGPVQYTLIPQFVAGLDVLLLPYKTGDLAESLSPLKLKEYLASKLPIVSSPIAQARATSDSLFLAENRADWVEVLNGILFGELRIERSAISKHLIGESWEHKADQFRALAKMLYRE